MPTPAPPRSPGAATRSLLHPSAARRAPCSKTRASTPAVPAATTCACLPPPVDIPRRASAEVLDHVGLAGGRQPARQGLLDGDAPAARDRGGAARRSRGADPRRAHQRARPAGDPLDARPAAGGGRQRAGGPGLQPFALRGRPERRRRRGHRRGQAARRGIARERARVFRTGPSRASAPPTPQRLAAAPARAGARVRAGTTASALLVRGAPDRRRRGRGRAWHRAARAQSPSRARSRMLSSSSRRARA